MERWRGGVDAKLDNLNTSIQANILATRELTSNLERLVRDMSSQRQQSDAAFDERIGSVEQSLATLKANVMMLSGAIGGAAALAFQLVIHYLR